MAKNRSKIKASGFKPFEAAGTLSYIGKEINTEPEVVLSAYNLAELKRFPLKHFDNITQYLDGDKRIWLDIDGVHKPQIVESIGKAFHLHPLLMEDVLNTTQKSKIEYFEEGNQLLVVLKMLNIDDDTLEIEAEHISLVLGVNYVISFQEKDRTDILENIHTRIAQGSSRIRKYQSDYLIYAIIDLVVDHHYVLLDKLSHRLEDLEETALLDPKPAYMNQIYLLKKELTYMRKTIVPLRDIIGSLIREESELVGHQVDVYLRDVQDHVLQNIDTLDTLRDLADNIMSNYHAALSNKMNSVMKTLTVFTAIFMPLSFITGFFGMNFKFMPALDNPDGYQHTLFLMLAIAIGLWIYFKWKKYI